MIKNSWKYAEGGNNRQHGRGDEEITLYHLVIDNQHIGNETEGRQKGDTYITKSYVLLYCFSFYYAVWDRVSILWWDMLIERIGC